MTEKALERAIYLDNRIKRWIKEKEQLEEIRNESTKNTPEADYICFCIEAIMPDGEKMSAYISSGSAKAALDGEIRILSKELEEMKKEFAELH